MERPHFATTAEWDWVYTGTYDGTRLHHLARIYNPGTVDHEWRADGVTSCGRVGTYVIPGLMSRMGMLRCKQCCDRLGWPHGIGSPKNDAALRPLVEARIANIEPVEDRTESEQSGAEHGSSPAST